MYWLVVSTHLKNISQIGTFPQVESENQKCLKPPPRVSQLGFAGSFSINLSYQIRM